MIEVGPVMLLILQIFSNDPVHVVLKRHPVLYESREECFAAADALLDDFAKERHTTREQLRHWCLPVPHAQEYLDLSDKASREAQPGS